MNIKGIHGISFNNGTEELIAVWSRAPMIGNGTSWSKAPITLTNDTDAHFASFLDGVFMVNGNDNNYFYNGTNWYSDSLNTADSPIGYYIREKSARIYLFNIKIAGTDYKSWVWKSDLPKNGQITWGLETGSDLVQTTASAVVTSTGSLFVTRNIKVGDPILITSGTNAGEYVVQSVDSETQLTLTTDMTNSATGSSFWVGGNYFPVSTDNGDIGMGIGEASNELLFFKRNSVDRYNDRGNELRRIKSAPGTTSPRSIVTSGDYCYWYHPTGIYRTTGASGQLISNGIYDVIEGVTTANQDNVVGWEEDKKIINMYLGDVTLRDGEVITDCVASFNSDDNTWSFRTYGETITCAINWLTSNLQKIYAGSTGGKVLQLNTGTSFNETPIGFELVDKPRFPVGDDVAVNFHRIREYVDNGADISISYKLLYRPTSDLKVWVSDKDWKPLKGAQRGEKTEFDFPIGERACGYQLKFNKSTAQESFLHEKYVLYYSNPALR